MTARFAICCATAALLVPSRFEPDSRSALANPQGTITGVVLSALDRQPVASASVVLTSLVDPAVSLTGASAADGTFRIENVPDGRYAIRAIKTSWVDGAYGSLATGYLGTPLAVKGADAGGVVLRLVPGAVLGCVVL